VRLRTDESIGQALSRLNNKQMRALERVQAAEAEQVVLDAKAAAMQTETYARIYEALEVGVPAAVIAGTTGYSVSRIYQIRTLVRSWRT
jgi:hypothetical protein